MAGPAPSPDDPAPALDLNDASILLPLPSPTQRDRMLGVTAAGPMGALIPDHVRALIPPLDPFRTNADVLQALRVVALRLDPCARDTPGMAGCQHQLRMVLQPLRIDGNIVLADDIALHAFYALTSGEFDALVSALRTWRRRSDPSSRGGPLRVHPALQLAGWDGHVAAEFNQLILGSAGADRLRRVTFMQLQGLRNQWRFGGFELVGSSWAPMAIPHAAGSSQTFTNILVQNELDFVATLTPAARPTDDFSVLFNSGLARQAAPEILEASHRAVLRVENPSVHDTRSLDCVSCHTAGAARTWLERNDVGGEQPGDRFTSLQPLVNSGVALRPSMLRAFGYFGKDAVLSQRVINETAVVLDVMQAR